jgi:RNA polymerase sigma-70 factor (ECF subfamily)
MSILPMELLVTTVAFAVHSLGRPELLRLVERIHQGDRSAESELARCYGKVLLMMLRQRCRPGESQLEDLLHDVLEALLQRFRQQSFNVQASVVAYVRSTVHNRCISHYRALAQRSATEAAQGSDQQDYADSLAQALLNEHTHAVRDLLAAVPLPRDRDVLRLFYLEQMDSAEICSRLNIDAEHFRRVLHRARQRMLAHIPADQREQLRA